MGILGGGVGWENSFVEFVFAWDAAFVVGGLVFVDESLDDVVDVDSRAARINGLICELSLT